MPNIVIPDDALVNWMQAQVDDLPTLNDMRLRLYSSPLVVDRYVTGADLVGAEAGFAGYVPVTLTDWTNAVMIDGEAVTEPSQATFTPTATSPHPTYGCFATSLAGDKLWFACAFTEYVPVSPGQELQIDLSLSLRSIFNS